jgi:phosphohistidine phosphatase SixA
MHEKKPLLLIMRHAKSDPNNAISDFERPLSLQGQQQLEVIAKKLSHLDITIDTAIVSPSLRTTQTWQFLSQYLENHPQPIFDRRLYHSSKEDIINVIDEHASSSRCLLIVAHCPSVIEVVELLSGEYHDFKPANVAILSPLTKRLDDALKKPRQFCLMNMITTYE